MEAKKQDREEGRCGTIVTASAKDVSRAKDRHEFVVSACRTITDEWFPRFRRSSFEGADAFFATVIAYKSEMLSTKHLAPDAIFRYSAIAMMLKTLSSAEGVSDTVRFAIDLVAEDTDMSEEFWFPWKIFPDEAKVFEAARNVSWLDAEYD